MHSISGNTRIFGILADPIHHVKTPQAINRLFESMGFDGVMVPFHVTPGSLGATLHGLRDIQNLDGFVVTVPHKTAVVDLCDELTVGAQQVGAVNVIRRTPEGRLIGGILDGDGFVEGLRAANIALSGQSAYLAGAGGAASAIAFALAKAGVSRLTIANRSAEKARSLLARVAQAYPAVRVAVGNEVASGHGLVINGTSLGLRPGDALPLNTETLDAAQIVAEIIMEPAQTPLLAAAAARGCRT
ncbi:shikimate dehydrogenase, partial [Ramlibacter sp. WS9]|uniref:shikimate dehydrogenase family protein n=1 Tax=Ramlibacter sp. WS9 TaxID=1882741 RepID=UPI001143AF36